jgi:hypothetical protein
LEFLQLFSSYGTFIGSVSSSVNGVVKSDIAWRLAGEYFDVSTAVQFSVVDEQYLLGLLAYFCSPNCGLQDSSSIISKGMLPGHYPSLLL